MFGAGFGSSSSAFGVGAPPAPSAGVGKTASMRFEIPDFFGLSQNQEDECITSSPAVAFGDLWQLKVYPKGTGKIEGENLFSSPSNFSVLVQRLDIFPLVAASSVLDIICGVARCDNSLIKEDGTTMYCWNYRSVTPFLVQTDGKMVFEVTMKETPYSLWYPTLKKESPFLPCRDCPCPRS